MDSKDVWPVVKFLVAATGLKRQDARRMLEEIPDECYSQLFIQSRAWDRDTSSAASKALGTILGESKLGTLVEATRKAQKPTGASDDEDDAPRRRTRKRT